MLNYNFHYFYFEDGNPKIPDDPSLLSFNVMKLGIFSEIQVSALLGIPSVNERLLCILKYWETDVINS